MPFDDRVDAGRRLGALLAQRGLHDAIVLGLPRGGVPVAAEVAKALGAPLDVVVARKIGAPCQPELGIGAIAEGGVSILEDHTLQALGLTRDDLAATIASETAELQRRVDRYRGDRPPPDVRGRTVVLVDDGLATGVSARAALRSLRWSGAARLLLAVPVGPPGAAALIGNDADEVVALEQPERLAAVGQWYRDFTQTSDDTVLSLLSPA